MMLARHPSGGVEDYGGEEPAMVEPAHHRHGRRDSLGGHGEPDEG